MSIIVEVLCLYFPFFRYYTDPSGTFWQCNAKAIGSGSEGADSSLQEQFNKVIQQDQIALNYITHYLTRFVYMQRKFRCFLANCNATSWHHMEFLGVV
jgi:20S proteasome alpha/beta subunit